MNNVDLCFTVKFQLEMTWNMLVGFRLFDLLLLLSLSFLEFVSPPLRFAGVTELSCVASSSSSSPVYVLVTVRLRTLTPPGWFKHCLIPKPIYFWFFFFFLIIALHESFMSNVQGGCGRWMWILWRLGNWTVCASSLFMDSQAVKKEKKSSGLWFTFVAIVQSFWQFFFKWLTCVQGSLQNHNRIPIYRWE